jgi:hypothetical protein
MPGFAPRPEEDSFDLVNAIWKLLQDSPIKWIGQFVDGHKDKITSHLTLQEQLNVRMDTLAKAYWRFLANKLETYETDYAIPIYEEGWQLWQGSTKIRDTSKNHLYSIIQDPITVNFWIRHKRFPSEASHLIDWTSSGQAIRSMKLCKRRRLSKHASKDCGVGTTLVKWNMQDDDHCPRCGASEDTAHVLKCTAATDIWEGAVSELETKLEAIDTEPTLLSNIVSALHSWWSDTPPPAPDPFHTPLLAQAVTEQSQIGWFPFVQGLISVTWKQVQAHHYSSFHPSHRSSRRTSKAWVGILIRQLHNLTDTMWAHRNDVKHKTLQPRQKRMCNILDREITREYLTGPAGLPRGDANRLFNLNIISLLQHNTHYKQAWLYQTAQARQRHQRRREQDNELNTISLTQSKLFKWAQTGIAT